MASVKYEKANAMRSSQRKLELPNNSPLAVISILGLIAALLLFWYFSVFSVTVQAFRHVYGLVNEPDNSFYAFLFPIAIGLLIYALSVYFSGNDDSYCEFPSPGEFQIEITTREAEFTPEKKMETPVSPDKLFLHKHKSKVGESFTVYKETVPVVNETTTCYTNVTTNEVKVSEKNYYRRVQSNSYESLKEVSPLREPPPPRRDDGSSVTKTATSPRRPPPRRGDGSSVTKIVTSPRRRGGGSSVSEITTNEVKVSEKTYHQKVQSNSYESLKVVSPRRGGGSSIFETTTSCTNMTTNEVKVSQKNCYQRVQSDSNEPLPPRGGGSSVIKTTTCCRNVTANEVKVSEKNCYRRVQSKSHEPLNVVAPRQEPPPSRRGGGSSVTETSTRCTNVTTNEVKVSKKKCYRKVQSETFEPLKVVASPRELKRFNTGFHEQQHRRMCPVEHLKGDELYEACMDFIAKQKRLLWEEKRQETEYLALRG